MSALFGIYYTDGRTVAPTDLKCMLESMAHRGTDGCACWQAGAVGLGHRMRWTTPESLHEVLPLVDASAELAITADARLDNRDDLFTALGLTSMCREDVSDSQLILAAYTQWSESCVTHLEGDFAFAIWDGRRRQLFCARDHCGIRPFFYCAQPGAFLFASEIKGILAGGVAGTIDMSFLAGYMVTLFDDAQATVYQQIRRLPAAHTLTVNADGLTLHRYWRLDATRTLRLRSDAEYAEAFREVFATAVQCRLRSAFSVGALLSGGMDSSSITCMARYLLQQEGHGRRLHTFSAAFDSLPSCDERAYSDAVVAQGGVIPHRTPVDHFGPFSVYCQGQASMDEPYYGTTLYLHWGLYQAARPHVRTLLDGHGGDTVVSHGTRYFAELAAGGRWMGLLQEARAFATRHGVRTADIIWHHGVLPVIPMGIKEMWRRIHHRSSVTSELARTLIAPEFAQRMGIHARLRANHQMESRAITVREEQRMELEGPIYQLIFDWFNTTAHTQALDVRYPFFDRRLIEFCLSLPPTQKMHHGWQRYVLRRAMDGLLPPAVQWRLGKANLAPCFYRNFASIDYDRVAHVLDSNMNAIAPYVDTAVLQHYRRWFADIASVRQHWLPIWLAATLAIWMEHTGSQGLGKEASLTSMAP